MKHITTKIAWAFVLVASLMASCKDDDEPGIPGGLALDKTEIAIGPEGGTERIQVSASTSWVASVSGPWVSVSPANGVGSAASELAIDSTLENTSRTIEIRYTPQGQQPQTVTITQFGFGKQILIKEPDVEIESSADYDDRYFDVTISTNVHFKIDENVEYSFGEEPTAEDAAEAETQREDWLELPNQNELEVDLDRKARPRSVTARFHWGMNTIPYTRVAKVKLLPINPEEDQLVDENGNPLESVTLTVTQKPALRITDDRAGDSLAIIMICEKIQTMAPYESGENMRNWEGVTLWERTDRLPDGTRVPDEWVGRVRSVDFILFNLQEEETFPREIRYLKYLEDLRIESNTNRQSREMEFGEDICELKHLKKLSIKSFGLIDLPKGFVNFGGAVDGRYDGLEVLELNSNNFASLSALTDVINPTNFPKLKTLDLSGCRRSDSFIDLTGTNGVYNNIPIGLWINIGSVGNRNAEREAFIQLLTWEKLTSLSLSYNYIEGELPSDDEMLAAIGTDNAYYKEEDFFEGAGTVDDWEYKISKDTCNWLLTTREEGGRGVQSTLNDEPVYGNEVPRVLPFTRSFSINLNFLTGPMPNWLLYHPYFVEWNPGSMILNQQEKGKNTAGVNVGFENVSPYDFDYSYYYGHQNPDMDNPDTYEGVAYPLYYYRYVAGSENADSE